MKQEQVDMRSAASRGMTSRESGQMFEEMLDAIRDSLRNLASLDDEEDGQNKEDTMQGKLSKDDEPGWVMSTITKTVQQGMQRFRQKQMKHDEMTQLGRGDVADYFRAQDKEYGTNKLKDLAEFKPHMDDDVVNPASSTFGALSESLDIIPRILQMLQGNSQSGSVKMRLGSGRPEWNICIASLRAHMESESSPIKLVTQFEPLILYL